MSPPVAAGHEPNGYFWEGLVTYLAPTLPERVYLTFEQHERSPVSSGCVEHPLDHLGGRDPSATRDIGQFPGGYD
jgi:hypothetical protein